jgi:hypothetical protein
MPVSPMFLKPFVVEVKLRILHFCVKILGMKAKGHRPSPFSNFGSSYWNPFPRFFGESGDLPLDMPGAEPILGARMADAAHSSYDSSFLAPGVGMIDGGGGKKFSARDFQIVGRVEYIAAQGPSRR